MPRVRNAADATSTQAQAQNHALERALRRAPDRSRGRWRRMRLGHGGGGGGGGGEREREREREKDKRENERQSALERSRKRRREGETGRLEPGEAAKRHDGAAEVEAHVVAVRRRAEPDGVVAKVGAVSAERAH